MLYNIIIWNVNERGRERRGGGEKGGREERQIDGKRKQERKT